MKFRSLMSVVVVSIVVGPVGYADNQAKASRTDVAKAAKEKADQKKSEKEERKPGQIYFSSKKNLRKALDEIRTERENLALDIEDLEAKISTNRQQAVEVQVVIAELQGKDHPKGIETCSNCGPKYAALKKNQAELNESAKAMKQSLSGLKNRESAVSQLESRFKSNSEKKNFEVTERIDNIVKERFGGVITNQNVVNVLIASEASRLGRTDTEVQNFRSARVGSDDQRAERVQKGLDGFSTWTQDHEGTLEYLVENWRARGDERPTRSDSPNNTLRVLRALANSVDSTQDDQPAHITREDLKRLRVVMSEDADGKPVLGEVSIESTLAQMSENYEALGHHEPVANALQDAMSIVAKLSLDRPDDDFNTLMDADSALERLAILRIRGDIRECREYDSDDLNLIQMEMNLHSTLMHAGERIEKMEDYASVDRSLATKTEKSSSKPLEGDKADVTAKVDELAAKYQLSSREQMMNLLRMQSAESAGRYADLVDCVQSDNFGARFLTASDLKNEMIAQGSGLPVRKNTHWVSRIQKSSNKAVSGDAKAGK